MRRPAVRNLVPLLVGVAVGTTGCLDRLTAAEAREAIEEVVLEGQAMSLAAGSVDLATNFTIGDAVEQAAEELRAFVTSQLPCAQATLSGATLTVTYGALPGACTYRGHTYSGTHAITIASASAGNLVVDHAWTDLSDGVVSVSGTAHVTWSSAMSSRRVEHALTWTRIADGRTGTGSGDRTQTVLAGGLVEGIRVDGDRRWTTSSGRWDLAIDAVEMRWVDPVPQSGRYTLDTPFDASLGLSFSRVDDDTIAVTLTSGRLTFTFRVSRIGTVSES